MLSQNKQRASPLPKPPAGNMAAGREEKTLEKRKKKNSIIAGLRKGWLFKPGLKQTLSSLYTHSLLTRPVASHHSVAKSCTDLESACD